MSNAEKKPEWLKVRIPGGSGDSAVRELLKNHNLNTVCQNALCPNMGECFGNKTATFMILGNVCTRACSFCSVMRGEPDVLSDDEPERLARYRNTVSPVIPERAITRAPSAELRPDQVDEDSLPSYDVLDAIVELYVEQDRSIADIVAKGYARADVERIVRLIHINEYKRRQAPPGIRITHRGFGKDWRYPITNHFRGGL